MRTFVATFGMLAVIAAWSGTVLAEPDEVIDTFDGTGGDSVTGSGQWAVITDQSSCDIQIYRLDYQTMQYDFLETVSSILGGTCTNGEFGLSSSLAGDVLVVGSPGWDGGIFSSNANNQGGIALFVFNGITWERQGGLNNTLGFIERAPDFQNGARYGSSVSISRIDDNNYLIVVGASLHDTGNGADTGKVYAYQYTVPSNDLAFLDDTEGAQAGDRFGFAVTANQPFTLVGAPGAGTGDQDNSPGAAYLYEVTGGALTLRDILATTGTDSLGREVSLSRDIALVSSDSDALVYENTIPPPALNRNYVLANTVSGVDGGDVSQSAGTAFFGIRTPGSEGAVGLSVPIAEDASTLGVAADVANIPAFNADDLSDVGLDIRLDREFLFFGNALEDRAILFAYPAGLGGFSETAFVYRQRSLPCDVTGLSVSDVFGYLGSSAGSGGSDFDIFLYDPTDVTDPNPYVQLNDTYTFTAADAAWSIWLATATGGIYTPVGLCNDFTTPLNVLPVDGGTAFVDTIVAQQLIELPEADTDPNGGDDFARAMINMPFPRAARLADFRYVDDSGATKTLAAADAADELFSTVYVYDPNSTIASGQNYRAITVGGTPPFEDRVQGYEGFWVKVEQNGNNNGAETHALLLPQPE